MKRRTRKVEQRLHKDCFFCSVAMATGHSYEQLGRKCGFMLMARVAQDASTNDLHKEVLKKAGLREFKNYRRVWCAPGYTGLRVIREMLWGRCAIIQVKLSDNTTHAIYWDGAKMHDPLPGDWYTWDNIAVLENVWLLVDEKTPRKKVSPPTQG